MRGRRAERQQLLFWLLLLLLCALPDKIRCDDLYTIFRLRQENPLSQKADGEIPTLPLAPSMASTRALVLSAVLAVASGTNEAFQAGNAHYARGELEEAREAYNECLREQPDRTDCATNLASVLIDLGPQHEAFAEALYRRVLAIEETHADAAFNLALLLQDRKTDEATRECVALYQLVVAAEPQLWDAWSNLASALTELKVPVQAVRASQRAIVLLEQAQQAAGGASDDAADTMLGKLYFLLAMALVDLTAEQCAEVASSPDSLMVGIDEHGNAEEAGVPLAAVCHENALNAPRHVETPMEPWRATEEARPAGSAGWLSGG